MGIFDRIKDALFGQAHAAPINTGKDLNSNTEGSAMPAASGASTASPVDQTADGANETVAQTLPGSVTTNQPVDIEAMLNDAVAKSGQKLDWRHSIVDLM